jgi:Zn-dependent protease
MARRRTPGTFVLLGFPTSIRPGFAVFVLFLAVLYPFPLGLWVAGAVAVFTVLHELGHALAARRFRCDASISLDFMVAYATYSSPVPLRWKQKIAISLSGPLLQVTTAMLALLAFGINPFSRGDIASSEVAAAVWWAGVALGMLNLIPLMPLDGGAVVSEIAERVFPERGRLRVLQLSFAVTVVVGAVCIFYGLVGLLPLFAFMLLLQYQQLFLPRRISRAVANHELAPQGKVDMDDAVLTALLEQRDHASALEYATQAYTKCPSFECALGAARASLALGHSELADAWLVAAHASQIDSQQFVSAMIAHPDLAERAVPLSPGAELVADR